MQQDRDSEPIKVGTAVMKKHEKCQNDKMENAS
jgi:hypothetical protein